MARKLGERDVIVRMTREKRHTWYNIVRRASGAVALLETAPATPPEARSLRVSRKS